MTFYNRLFIPSLGFVFNLKLYKLDNKLLNYERILLNYERILAVQDNQDSWASLLLEEETGLFSLRRGGLRGFLSILSIPKERKRGHSQAHFISNQCQGKMQQAQTGIQEVPSEHQEDLLYCVGDRALA